MEEDEKSDSRGNKRGTKKRGCDKETLDKITEKMKATRKKYDDYHKKCENELYADFVSIYFKDEDGSKLTHLGLLTGLKVFYSKMKTENPDYILSLHEFIQKFPQKTAVSNTNYKRQHIFEAICRLLIYFNYDNGELGKNKHFYYSLETFIKTMGKGEKINDKILDTAVNEGSKNGIVDIFFESRIQERNDDLWGCESIIVKNTKTKIKPRVELVIEDEDIVEEIVSVKPVEKNEFIMIQNKYYDTEKSNVGKYDIPGIYTLAKTNNENRQIFNGSKVKIILMVNNEDALSHNLNRAKQKHPDLIHDIYGVARLNNWFQQMLYDIFKSESFDKFFTERHGTKASSIKPSLQLRFHQHFFIKCSNKYIEQEKRKLIWGAVPRSGKSYMIGGLIAERYKKGRRFGKNVVLILGAKTETLPQFIDMFNKFSDFDDFSIITPDIKNKSKEGTSNIYIFSQEWFKSGKIKLFKEGSQLVPENAQFEEVVKTKYPYLFGSGESIDLYFDEVHKGGSTDTSESILHAFHNARIKIDIFIMVTATFAKPTLRYANLKFIDDNTTAEIIEWSYNDQQTMKTLTDETKKHMLINTRDGKQEQITALKECFEFYKDYYGLNYLNALSKEYEKHPELVLITPQSVGKMNLASDSVSAYSTDDIRNVFLNNLRCDACAPDKKNIDFYRDPRNIFNQIQPVQNLLDYISITLYNYFHSTINYRIDSPHTELWFLPDKHLYGTDSECRDICKPQEKDTTMDEDDNTKSGIPNIEPLTRGLAILICKHGGFSRYNVLIVHNTKLKYLGSDISAEKVFEPFYNKVGSGKMLRINSYDSSASQGLSEQIKNFERETFLQGKSLIILTGAKLRLGISLPCADIAFNFDDVKSIDNNYQTMFRVLTEREKPTLKKYGYYVDFNKGRSIQFMYEYNKIYGDAKTVQKTKEAVDSLQSLLFTFNYNGLNLIKSKTEDDLKIYNHLINDLELTPERYVQFWSKKENIISLIKKSFITFKDTGLLKELKKIMQFSRISKPNKPGKVRHEIVEGEQRKLPAKKDNEESDKSFESDESEIIDEMEADASILNNLAEVLPSIIVLLALGSKEYDCENIEQCLEINIRYIDSLVEQCSCNTIDNANLLDCFLNSPGLISGNYLYDKKRLIKLIEILLLMIKDKTLGDNLNFIFDNIKGVMRSSNKNLIFNMDANAIEEKIEQYLSVRTDEKDKFGEVFTPVELIEEMLAELPKSVWSNPDLKWLDPANGIGNFPMVVYKHLDEGLKKWQPNDKKRSEWIIKEMLYMVEINPKNVKIAKKIFGDKANICCGNFEDDKAKCFNQFKIDKFDIIIGNPPFQDEIAESETKKPRKGGKNKLYERITVQCLELLKDKGYLLFVTPDNIMTGNTNKSYEEFIKYNVISANFNNIQKRYFPTIGQSMCYFLINKTEKNNKLKTLIVNKNNEKVPVVLEDRAINPIGEWTSKTEKYMKEYMTNERNDAVYNRGTSESDYTGGKYAVVYQPEKILHTNRQELAPGIGIKKIILFESKPMSSGFIDLKGEYGVGPHTFYVPFNSRAEGLLLQRFFKSDIYKTLVRISITSQYLKTSLITHINVNKILLRRENKTKKNMTTDDIKDTSSLSTSKTKKQRSADNVKKHRKTRSRK